LVAAEDLVRRVEQHNAKIQEQVQQQLDQLAEAAGRVAKRHKVDAA
jgi:hypothetical protein